jgi:hypothetical protein
MTASGMKRVVVAFPCIDHTCRRRTDPAARDRHHPNWIGVEAEIECERKAVTILAGADLDGDGMVDRCSWVSFATPAVDRRADG